MPGTEFDLTKHLPPPEPDPRGRIRTNYGCSLIVTLNDTQGCMVCGAMPSLSFDSSDGEYAEITLCRKCLLDMLYGFEPNEPRTTKEAL